MARDGSGTYTNPHPDFVAGTVISSTEVDANNSDIATALTQSIAVDGQTTVTANLPMATYKFTGLGAGSAATDSANLGQVQAGSYIWCGTMAGGADAGTLSPAPAITAYAAGQRFAWKASTSANTGAMTVAISGLTTIAVQNDRAALAAGDHAASDIYMGILDTASTIQIMKVAGVAGAVLGPASATDNAVARFDTTTGKLIQNSGVLITDANEVTATGFTGTLDGVLGGGTPAAASITTLTLTNDLTVANGGTGASTFTANNVLTGNGTSAFGSVAPSTSGNVLTSNGSAWTSAAGSSGGLVFLQGVTASNDATVNITTGIDSTYETYLLLLNNVIPVTDGTQLYLRTSTDGGSSFDSSAGNYRWAQGREGDGGSSSSRSASDTQIELTGSGQPPGSAAGESVSGTIYIYYPSNTAQTCIGYDMSYMSSGGSIVRTFGAGLRTSAADVDALQLLFASGNVESGEINLYGLVKS